MNNKLNIKAMPLYWRVSPVQVKDAVIPDRLPFSFDFDNSLGLLTQQENRLTQDALNEIYTRESNVGYLQDNNHLSKSYGVDFFTYLETILTNHQDIKNILEIGCGGCTILEKLKEIDYHVLGIDSSPFAKIEGKKKNIDVITDFYPSPQINENFDLIFCVDVLEHINNPAIFLRKIKSNLGKKGILVINVPDCTESIEAGDISMIIHQHINYFNLKSLAKVVTSAGYDVLNCQQANYGGSIYLTAIDGGSDTKVESEASLDFSTFQNKAFEVLNKFKSYVKSISTDEHELGFYVPLRAMPYIAFNELDSNYRIFDDTEHWHEQYIDGYQFKIENFEDLKKSPVTHLVVMSLTFGEVIKKKIKADKQTAHIKITLLKEFF